MGSSAWGYGDSAALMMVAMLLSASIMMNVEAVVTWEVII